MHYIIAHDLGTSGNKATLYNEEGMLVCSATAEYETFLDAGGIAEQDAEEWWRAVIQSTQFLLESAGVNKADIACISFSGQMMGCLPVDAKGNPLRNAIIWADMRSEDQARVLRNAIPEREFYKIVWHRPISSYTLTKLMWIRDHEPSVYSATDKTLQAKDYIVYKMTGVLATDYSDASGTNAFDLIHKCWSNPILRAVKIDPSLFPESYPSTTVIGRVTREAAALTGLQEGTPVVLGGGDGSCAIVGAGIYGRQKAYAILGSSSWIAFETDSPLDDEEMRFMTWAHLEDGKYEPCGTMQAAGLSIEWIKDVLANGEGFEQLEIIASHAPPGSKNLLYLPYLLGERSPRWDPNAKGCFIGLTSKHSRADIFRSVYEGIAYNLKTILNIFSDKVDLNDITLIGGGAKSTLWRHVLADVWAKPVKIPRYLEEATSIGAAIAGGVGVGLFKDFSICKQCNPILENIEPVIQNSQLYERLYPLFEASYRNLKEVFHELGEYQK